MRHTQQNSPVFSLILSLFLAGPLASGEDAFRVAVKKNTESYDRKVDQAAISSQDQAISKTQALVKKYTGTRQEPILLQRLADMFQQRAAIEFRVAHGISHERKSTLDLSVYKKTMAKSITTIDVLLKKFPNFELADLALFMRGKAYEETGDKKSATRDYTAVVTQFPDTPEAPSAYMSLAQFAIDDNQHERALGFLKQVEARPEDSRYPFALFKMGWSLYNLKRIDEALRKLEKHIDVYRAQSKSEKGLGHSDEAILENSLLDTALFYFEGFELKQDGFTVDSAYAYFKKLESGPYLGRMLLRFAKLLRAHDLQSDLLKWKDLMVAQESKRPETFEIAMVTFENQLNRRQYAELLLTSKDFVKLYERDRAEARTFESFQKTQKLLLDTAKTIQKLTIKNRGATQVDLLSSTLAGLYDTFTRIVDETDPRVPGVHYNLAETLFEIKDFAQATTHYRWVVDRWQRAWKNSGVDLKTAHLRAISSRYEVLKSQRAFPEKLEPVVLAADRGTPNTALSEYIQWLTIYRKDYFDKSNPSDEFLAFDFEATRALYALGNTTTALARSEQLALQSSHSKFAIPAASLVMDTLLKSENWEKVRDQAARFSEVTSWKDAPFRTRLEQLSADASYKLLEKSALAAKKSPELATGFLKLAEDYLKRYAKHPRSQDALLLAIQTSLVPPFEAGRFARGYALVERLLTLAPESENAGLALVDRFHARELEGDLPAAALDLQRVLGHPKAKLTSEERAASETRLVALSFLTESKPGGLCETPTPERVESCDRLQVLEILRRSDAAETELKFRFDRALKAPKLNRPLWAMSAFIADVDERSLNFPDRILLLRIIATGYDDLDPLVQIAAYPALIRAVPRGIAMNRKAIARFAQIKPTEKAIKHRVELVQELESVAARAAKLPWTRLQSAILAEVAGLYLDFGKALQGAPEPTQISPSDLAAYQEMVQKLALPFEEKGQEIQRKSFEIGSLGGIETESFAPLQTAFFQDNPSQAKALQLEVTPPVPYALTDPAALTKALFPDLRLGSPQTPQELAVAKVLSALGSKRGPLAAHLTKTFESTLSPALHTTLRVFLLSSIGAQAEALAELDKNGERFSGRAREIVTSILLGAYGNTLQREKCKNAILRLERFAPEQRLAKLDLSTVEAAQIAILATWSGAQLSPENMLRMLDEGRGVSKPVDAAKWLEARYRAEKSKKGTANPSPSPSATSKSGK